MKTNTTGKILKGNYCDYVLYGSEKNNTIEVLELIKIDGDNVYTEEMSGLRVSDLLSVAYARKHSNLVAPGSRNTLKLRSE